MVTTIGTDALRAALDDDSAAAAEKPQLVEVLPATEFSTEHLPGAVHLPLTQLTRSRALSALDPSRPVVVYCFDFQ